MGLFCPGVGEKRGGVWQQAGPFMTADPQLSRKITNVDFRLRSLPPLAEGYVMREFAVILDPHHLVSDNSSRRQGLCGLHAAEACIFSGPCKL